MIRRTFLTALSCVTLAACVGCSGSSSKAGPHPNPGVFELAVVDHETPFGDAAVPYVQALAGAGKLPAAGVELVKLPSYGREGHHVVDGATIAVAKERAVLERAFDELPEEWRLPPSHALRYGQRPWRDDELLWGAYVIKSEVIVNANDVIDLKPVEVSGVMGVEIYLSSAGTQRLAELSGASIGRKLAIVVDGEVLADPIVNDAITGGKVMISVAGGDAEHEALAKTLRDKLAR